MKHIICICVYVCVQHCLVVVFAPSGLAAVFFVCAVEMTALFKAAWIGDGLTDGCSAAPLWFFTPVALTWAKLPSTCETLEQLREVQPSSLGFKLFEIVEAVFPPFSSFTTPLNRAVECEWSWDVFLCAEERYRPLKCQNACWGWRVRRWGLVRFDVYGAFLCVTGFYLCEILHIL